MKWNHCHEKWKQMLKAFSQSPVSRRQVLQGMPWALAAAVGSMRMPASIWAMGNRSYPQGIRRARGQVLVNGQPASVGDLVAFGDRIQTGKKSMAAFVIGTSAWLMRENTDMQLMEKRSETANRIQPVMRIIRGGVLSVFRKKNMQIQTSTAVIGVRGTGIYAEECEPGTTYVCLCYGRANIQPAGATRSMSIHTRHHEHPLYVRSSKADTPISRGPMKNHTDEELILLESMVGRRPPFVFTNPGQGGNGGGY